MEYIMAKILVVDDEKPINDLITMNLQLVDHEVQQAFHGEEALDSIRREIPDLVILDIMLPGMDGYELLPHFIEMDIPVIFLTAKDMVQEMVYGLQLGADDYIRKPFEEVELIARVDAVLRRSGKIRKFFSLGEAEVDLLKREVKLSGAPVELTAQEYRLLEILIRNVNIALSRDQLLDEGWGFEYEGETRTVDMHIQRLRKKLGWEKKIVTVYRYGYRLEK